MNFKFVSGNGPRKHRMTVEDGTRAFHRCAMGMCYKKCILQPIEEVACEECITALCQKAR